MTATKVECQELNTDGPSVEEIATYSYSVQEETVQKPQNGVLIEEFSENSEDNRSKLQVNRGVSIISVSDDESTMKAISRDVSTEDMLYAELSEDQKLVNGSYEDFNGSGRLADEKMLDDAKPYRGSLITETIMEERSLEEAPSEKLTLQRVKQPESAVVENGETPRRKSSMNLEQPQTPTIEDSKMTKHRIERVNSTAEKVVEQNLEGSRRGSMQNGLSRQSSKIERMDSTESKKALERSVSRESALKATPSGDEEVDEEFEALLDRVKRQRSVLDDILEKESSRDSGTTGLLHRLLERIRSCRSTGSKIDYSSVL